ncbi:MAG: alanine racemase [Deltaproteobacteria bacterium]|jgi:alanine racemase|nr:alanine racemase [Deltaproteobacteria bacterium]
MANMEKNSLTMETFSFNRVEIDIVALQNNFQNIQQKVGSRVKVMAVVKSDAYGHGMTACARELYQVGARTFGVAEVWEGVALRRAGVRGEIIVLLGGTPETYDAIIDHNLTPVVYDIDFINGLSHTAAVKNTEARVHLKVDVGMGRLGIQPSQVETYISLIKRLPAMSLSGLLSHFPVADESEAFEKTRKQLASFKEVVARLKAKKDGPVVSHIANSAAFINFPETHLDMIRPGISLYGYFPDASPKGAKRAVPSMDLQPVMSFKTRVVQIKELEAGCGISYGHTFITSRKSRIAVLPVGYADGYQRKLSNRAEVLINGRRAPVCGRVCMNATMVDITDLPPVDVGDEVVLLGRQGGAEISADEIAQWLGTISYEVLCLFGSLNERVYLSNDQKMG